MPIYHNLTHLACLVKIRSARTPLSPAPQVKGLAPLRSGLPLAGISRARCPQAEEAPCGSKVRCPRTSLGPVTPVGLRSPDPTPPEPMPLKLASFLGAAKHHRSAGRAHRVLPFGARGLAFRDWTGCPADGFCPSPVRGEGRGLWSRGLGEDTGAPAQTLVGDKEDPCPERGLGSTGRAPWWVGPFAAPSPSPRVPGTIKARRFCQQLHVRHVAPHAPRMRPRAQAERLQKPFGTPHFPAPCRKLGGLIQGIPGAGARPAPSGPRSPGGRN